MTEPLLSSLAMLTEFLSTDHIEAAARRTGFVQRAFKITGKVFLALVTFGPWSTAKTSLAQLAAKAAQLPAPVEVSPEAIHQRLNTQALAFLREMLQSAFAKLHAGTTVCEEGLFAAFTRVHIADSTGFGLPESLKALFPGAGGSGAQAGAKLQLVGDYKSGTFDHFALIPWNIPDNKYIDTVVALAPRGALFLSAQSSNDPPGSGWGPGAGGGVSAGPGDRVPPAARESGVPGRPGTGRGAAHRRPDA